MGGEAGARRRFDAGAFVFASDLVDEGVEQVLANLQERGGLDAVMPAFTYHAARDVFPHNPRRTIVTIERGECFYHPDPAAFAGMRIQPVVSPIVAEGDVLQATCSAAAARGMDVRAWTVFLHLDRPDVADCCVLNALGDRLATDLCPANPDVRDYVRALVADIARYDVRAIVAESLHYHPIEHGNHHERYFIELGAFARYLLGICFCEHCIAAAERADVDGRRVAGLVADELRRVFADRHAVVEGELDHARLAAFADGALGRYLEARSAVVTTLAEDAARAARDAGTTLSFIELSGAVKGYATGRPTGAPAVHSAWRQGVDVEAVAAACDEVEVLGYAAEIDRLVLELDAYRDVLGATPLAVALRPSPPDCSSPEDLAAKVEAVRALGAVRVDFYHYGFLRLEALDWIREALSS